jgi:hypothetical protein
MEKNSCLFLASVLFLLASCSESEEYMETYNGCRTLPGDESVKIRMCPKLAELLEKEKELQLKLDKIKEQQQGIIILITSSANALP